MATFVFFFLLTLYLTPSLSLTLHDHCEPSNLQHYWSQLQSLLQNATQVIDLSIFKDRTTLNYIRERFPTLVTQYCSCTVTLNDSFICDVIKVSLKIVSSSIKETLSKHNITTLSFTNIQSLSSWRHELLVTTLAYCPSFNVNKPTCSHSQTPLEYSIQLGQLEIAQYLLMKYHRIAMYNASVLHNILSLAVSFQNKAFVSLVMERLTPPSTIIYGDDNITQLASLHCWLYDWGCQIWSIIKSKREEDKSGKERNEKNTLSTIIGSLPSSIDSLHNYNYSQSSLSFDISPLYTSSSSSSSRRILWKTNPCNYCYYYHSSSDTDSGGWLIYGNSPLLGKSGCDMPVFDARYLTTSSFSHIVSLKIPILLTDVPYFTQLSDIWRKANLIKHFSEIDLLAGPIPYGQVFGEHFGLATVKEFIHYMERYSYDPIDFDAVLMGNEKVDLPFYVFDGEVMDKVFQTFFKIPELYSLWNNSEFYHQFILGPRGSGAPFHYHCSAINYLAYGRKKWFLYPPGNSVYSKVHPLHWFKNEYEALSTIDKPVECIQKKNEIIYVPSGWSHSTLNIDECVGMATEFNTHDC